MAVTTYLLFFHMLINYQRHFLGENVTYVQKCMQWRKWRNWRNEFLFIVWRFWRLIAISAIFANACISGHISKRSDKNKKHAIIHENTITTIHVVIKA